MGTQEDRWSRRGRTEGRISMARLDGSGPALNNVVEIERSNLIRSWRHPQARPVRTPAGDFPSAAAAGLHHGIRRHTAARWGSARSVGLVICRGINTGRAVCLAFRIHTRFTVDGLK
jgi:hypothetical protein